MAFDISDIVEVNAVVAPSTVATDAFGKALFLEKLTPSYTSVKLDEHRSAAAIASYRSAGGVTTEYGATSKAGVAATAYFSQNPGPRNFIRAAWCPGGTLKILVSAASTTTVSTIKGITGANSTTVTIGDKTTSGIDLSGVSAKADIATALARGLNGLTGVSNATVTYASNVFTITARATDALDFTSGVTILPAGVAAGMGFTDPFGQQELYLAGIPVETGVADALSRIRREFPDWYYVVPSSDIVDDETPMLAMADWTAAEKKGTFLMADTAQSLALATSDSSSVAKQIVDKGYRDTALFWGRHPGLAVRVAGKMSGMDMEQANSLLNPMYAGAGGYVGATPDNTLTNTETTALETKRVNYYIGHGGRETLRKGWTSKGWIDSQIWIDWFSDALQVAAFDHLKRAPNRVPLTREGVAGMKGALERVCERGIRNGGIAPGRLSDAMAGHLRGTTGLSRFDGDLTSGYMVWHVPVSLLDQADRDKRESPRFTVWVKGSGAINELAINVVYEE